MFKTRIRKTSKSIYAVILGIATVYAAMIGFLLYLRENTDLVVVATVFLSLIFIWGISGYICLSKNRNKKHRFSLKVRRWVWVVLILSILISLGTLFMESVRTYVKIAIWGTPPACPYANVIDGDDAAIQWLIKREAQAVAFERIDQIQEVFYSSALITDYSDRNKPVQFPDPYERYQTLFNQAQYKDPINNNIRQLVLLGESAYYISGSEGWVTDQTGKTSFYSNADDANHWTFRKIDGCWKIIQFDFNASGIPFPVGVKAP